MSSAGDAIVVRRPTMAKFRPRPEAAKSGTADPIIGPVTDKVTRQTERLRRVSGELPDWDLLPPGELRVKRG